jgi:hypothetical protein
MDARAELGVWYSRGEIAPRKLRKGRAAEAIGVGIVTAHIMAGRLGLLLRRAARV